MVIVIIYIYIYIDIRPDVPLSGERLHLPTFDITGLITRTQCCYFGFSQFPREDPISPTKLPRKELNSHKFLPQKFVITICKWSFHKRLFSSRFLGNSHKMATLRKRFYIHGRTSADFRRTSTPPYCCCYLSWKRLYLP